MKILDDMGVSKLSGHFYSGSELNFEGENYTMCTSEMAQDVDKPSFLWVSGSTCPSRFCGVYAIQVHLKTIFLFNLNKN